MIALLLTPPILMQAGPPVVVQPYEPNAVVELCKPILARKAGGEIATIDVDSTEFHGSKTRISGRLTAFQRMGPAPAGTARTHHIGRIDFTFRCTVKNGRVRKAAVNLFRR